MDINSIFREWCSGEYKGADEDYYIANARCMVLENLSKIVKYSSVCLLGVFVLLTWLTTWTFSFFICGTVATAVLSYVLIHYGCGETNVSLFVSVMAGLSYSGISAKLIYSSNHGLSVMLGAIVCLAFFASSVLFGIAYAVYTHRFKKKYADKIEREAKEETESYKKKTSYYGDRTYHSSYTSYTYEQYQRDYNEYSKTNSQDNAKTESRQEGYKSTANKSNGNSLDDKARALFDGYLINADVFKKRYRTLVKQYHPDHGGDEELMKAINKIHEELAGQFN